MVEKKLSERSTGWSLRLMGEAGGEAVDAILQDGGERGKVRHAVSSGEKGLFSRWTLAAGAGPTLGRNETDILRDGHRRSRGTERTGGRTGFTVA